MTARNAPYTRIFALTTQDDGSLVGTFMTDNRNVTAYIEGSPEWLTIHRTYQTLAQAMRDIGPLGRTEGETPYTTQATIDGQRLDDGGEDPEDTA